MQPPILEPVVNWHAPQKSVSGPRLRIGCTIGTGAVILGDIDIGEGSVVAAGSVLLRDVPPGIMVAGVPAKPKARSAASFSGF